MFMDSDVVSICISRDKLLNFNYSANMSEFIIGSSVLQRREVAFNISNQFHCWDVEEMPIL